VKATVGYDGITLQHTIATAMHKTLCLAIAMVTGSITKLLTPLAGHTKKCYYTGRDSTAVDAKQNQAICTSLCRHVPADKIPSSHPAAVSSPAGCLL